MGISLSLSPAERGRYGLADLALAIGGEPCLPGTEVSEQRAAVMKHFRAMSIATDALSGREMTPHHDPFRYSIPDDFLGRALSSNPGSKGGALVGSDLDIIPTLRNRGILRRLPVRRYDGLKNNVTLARGATSVTVTWQAGDGTSVSSSDPALGQGSLMPRTVTVVVETSLQLLASLGAARNGYLLDELDKAEVEDIDKKFVGGSGASGEPLGILNTPGINSQAGSALAWSGVADMLRQAELYTDDESLIWLVAPDVAKLLRTRERASGSGFIMEGSVMAGVPAIVSNGMPAGSLLIVPWSKVRVATWTAAQLDIAPGSSGNFNAGKLAFRLLYEMDWLLEQPAAGVKATSIT